MRKEPGIQLRLRLMLRKFSLTLAQNTNTVFEDKTCREELKLQGNPLERRQAAMESMMSEWPGLEIVTEL